jgi:putative addiction module killer protein
MIVTSYQSTDGACPFDDWFQSLSPEAAIKVSVALQRLELGNLSSVKWLEGIGEYRIDWGPGLRIYLIQTDQGIILLWGGSKKRQSADIQKGRALAAEYKGRKKVIDHGVNAGLQAINSGSG